MNNVVVSCRELKKTYQGPAPVQVLHGVNLDVRASERIAIVGQGDPTRFLAGNPHARYLPPQDVEGRRKLMAEAAAFICPTQYVEPFGNVAVEAQMSGTPVITTAIADPRP